MSEHQPQMKQVGQQKRDSYQCRDMRLRAGNCEHKYCNGHRKSGRKSQSSTAGRASCHLTVQSPLHRQAVRHGQFGRGDDGQTDDGENDRAASKINQFNPSFTRAREHHLLLVQILLLPHPGIGQQRGLTVAHGDPVQMVGRVEDHRTGHIHPLMVL